MIVDFPYNPRRVGRSHAFKTMIFKAVTPLALLLLTTNANYNLNLIAVDPCAGTQETIR